MQNKFFNPSLSENLLSYIVARDVKTIRQFLTQDFSLIAKKGDVTDPAGRQFISISPFEYALWALDKHLWTMLLECIPDDENGRALVNVLLEQFQNIKLYGVTYTLNEKVVIEPHFDFVNGIIKELKTQATYFDNPDLAAKGNIAEDQWIKGVGGAQAHLPLHAISEYSSTSFENSPNFNIPPVDLPILNTKTNKLELCSELLPKLGKDVAIYKGDNQQAYAGVLHACVHNFSQIMIVQTNLNAMELLFAKRMKEFNNLGLELKRRLDDDNHPVFHSEISPISK